MSKLGLYRIFQVWDAGEILKTPAKAFAKLYFFPGDPKKPFAVVCPGGAYARVSRIIEGVPTAVALSQAGYPTFVLVYRTGLYAHHPAPLDDLAQALRWIFAQANSVGLSNLHYSVWGYSAGGHLALCWGTESVGAKAYGLPPATALIASYPLVSMGKETHRLSRRLLLGKTPAPEAIESLSVEMQVTGDFPPTYVWHCDEDAVVPISNSNRLVESLNRAEVPCQYRVVLAAGHGIGLGLGTPAAGWLAEAVAFWERYQLPEVKAPV